MIGGMMNGFGGIGSLGLIGGILNLLITIGLIVGIVFLVIWLVKRFGANAGQTVWPVQRTDSAASPREILQARYARGEITREQYQNILTDLS